MKKKHTYNSHPVITVFMLSLPSDPDKKTLIKCKSVICYKTEIDEILIY